MKNLLKWQILDIKSVYAIVTDGHRQKNQKIYEIFSFIWWRTRQNSKSTNLYSNSIIWMNYFNQYINTRNENHVIFLNHYQKTRQWSNQNAPYSAQNYIQKQRNKQQFNKRRVKMGRGNM